MPVISTRVQFLLRGNNATRPKKKSSLRRIKALFPLKRGYALTIRKAKTKWGRYFVCSQSGNHGNCKGAGCTIYADVLEEYMLGAIKERLSEFHTMKA